MIKQIQIAKDLLKEINQKIQKRTIIYRADKEDHSINFYKKIIDFDYWKSFTLVKEIIN
jgi:hypothetical protein